MLKLNPKLEYYYKDFVIYWGYTPEIDKLTKDNLRLYKTGRTNANDGGIDFVMKPLGRFLLADRQQAKSCYRLRRLRPDLVCCGLRSRATLSAKTKSSWRRSKLACATRMRTGSPN